jgi:secondary thiamine-phosphate synthase enzyme
MKVKFDQLKISTEYENQLINLDEMINKVISNYDCIDGVVNLFVPGSTGGITTIEYESGLIKDLPNILDKIIPPDGSDYKYFHNVYNGDDNGHSHVRASIIGPSLTIPFKNKRLLTGTWQNIIFIELDRHAPRRRTIQVTILGN